MPPPHAPAVHTSPVVHGSPSVHAVPFGTAPSGGQVVLAPVQVSVASHWSADGRHTAPALPAGWPHAPVPSHWSRVQGLASAVHAVPAGSKQLSAPSLQTAAHSGPAA